MTRPGLIAFAVAAVVFMALAFLAGRSLRSEAKAANAFELDAPAYEAAGASVSGISKGGFSGFTETGAEGSTVVSGKVVDVTPDSITIEGQTGQRSTLKVSGSARMLRLESGSRDLLRPGVTV